MGLPSAGLVLSMAGAVLGYRSRRPAPVVLVLAVVCIVAWYVGIGR